MCQWKFAGIVDGVGRAAHVGLPSIGAGFAAAAALTEVEPDSERSMADAGPLLEGVAADVISRILP